jgi:hypothetical protein
MTTRDELTLLLRRHPFRPFVVRTRSGKPHHVPLPGGAALAGTAMLIVTLEQGGAPSEHVEYVRYADVERIDAEALP